MKHVRFDWKQCMSCRACEIACGERRSFLQGWPELCFAEPRPIPRVRVTEKRDRPHLLRCQFCKNPKCIEACEYDTISQEEDGFVRFDDEKCTACWECIEACPFDCIEKDEFHGVAVRCDLCEGYEDLACISSCPTDALTIKE
ncbi:MAG: 4Fe-4S dicluster domain-containing protein [Thermoplasmata archaeon]